MKNYKLTTFLGFILLFVLSASLYNCTNSKIEGLWIVRSVKVGTNEMTPNARWVRFDKNEKQSSGNGRFQHSYGTWTFNKKTNKLSIINTNGIADTNAPFTVKFEENKMIWKRNEEGQTVIVSLERATELPETYSDQLLGLWELESTEGEIDENYFEIPKKTTPHQWIFFRWDKQFVFNGSKGKFNGMYHVNAHQPKVDLIPFSDEISKNSWTIEYFNNQLILSQKVNDKHIKRVFKRIHTFPTS